MNFSQMLSYGPRLTTIVEKPKRTSTASASKSVRVTAEYRRILGNETLSTTEVAKRRAVCTTTASSAMHSLSKRGLVENAGYTDKFPPVALWKWVGE